MTVAKFCPECGTATSGAKFCPECGTATATGGGTVDRAPSPVQPPGDGELELWHGSPDQILEPLGSRSTKYVLTSERMRVNTGLIGKKAEQMDLFRVKDVRVTRGLKQRARGCGDVLLMSTDPTTPELVLSCVKEPDALAEIIRTAVREARKRAGVRTQEFV